MLWKFCDSSRSHLARSTSMMRRFSAGHLRPVQPDALEHRAVPGLQHDLEGLRLELAAQPVVRHDPPRAGAGLPPLPGPADHGHGALGDRRRRVDDAPVARQLRPRPRDLGVDGAGVAGGPAAVEALEVDRVLGRVRPAEVLPLEAALVERAELVGPPRRGDLEADGAPTAALQDEPEAVQVVHLGRRGADLGDRGDRDDGPVRQGGPQDVAALARRQGLPAPLRHVQRDGPGPRALAALARHGLEVERQHLAVADEVEPGDRVGGRRVHRVAAVQAEVRDRARLERPAVDEHAARGVEHGDLAGRAGGEHQGGAREQLRRRRRPGRRRRGAGSRRPVTADQRARDRERRLAVRTDGAGVRDLARRRRSGTRPRRARRAASGTAAPRRRR